MKLFANSRMTQPYNIHVIGCSHFINFKLRFTGDYICLDLLLNIDRGGGMINIFSNINHIFFILKLPFYNLVGKPKITFYPDAAHLETKFCDTCT